MAGLGAGWALSQRRIPFTCYDKNGYFGGHTRSLHYEPGFTFDEGGHISFTQNEHVRDVLARAVEGNFEEKKLEIDNYWRGYRIPHPVQCNLRHLPAELIVKIVTDFIQAREQSPVVRTDRYSDWLHDSYGKTFAETFPITYGKKYHTTSMDRLTTDWIGPRMYRPSMEEILFGCLPGANPYAHYVGKFRYPCVGGFESYLRPLLRGFDLQLDHRLVRIDTRARLLFFSNKRVQSYGQVISSIPLPELIPLIDDVPDDVVEASRQLAFTSAVLVNIGLDREDISSTAITYFYDKDIVTSRVNLPHLFSSRNAPAGCGCIQAEVYFSDKYQPLNSALDEVASRVIDDLRRCGFIRETDKILLAETVMNRYANIIYDHDRSRALEVVLGFLKDVGVQTCGRYGKWNHDWTDQAFLDGEATALAIFDDPLNGGSI